MGAPRQMHEMREHGVAPQFKLTNSETLRPERASTGSYAQLLMDHGLNLDEINRYINNVQAISASDIQKFASKTLDAKTSSIIIVGNAKAFLPELQKKYPNVEVIPVSELDLNTALLKKKQAAG